MRDVSDVADERRCLLDDAVNIISCKLAEFQGAYDTLEQWQTDGQIHHDEALRHISTSAELFKSLVDEKQQRLNDDVEKLFQKRLELINDLRTAIDDQLPDLQFLLLRYTGAG